MNSQYAGALAAYRPVDHKASVLGYLTSFTVGIGAASSFASSKASVCQRVLPVKISYDFRLTLVRPFCQYISAMKLTDWRGC